MAKSSKSKRTLVGLVSGVSKLRNYYTTKNKQNTPGKLSLRKYDPRVRKHVTYTETKTNLGRNIVKARKG